MYDEPSIVGNQQEITSRATLQHHYMPFTGKRFLPHSPAHLNITENSILLLFSNFFTLIRDGRPL